MTVLTGHEWSDHKSETDLSQRGTMKGQMENIILSWANDSLTLVVYAIFTIILKMYLCIKLVTLACSSVLVQYKIIYEIVKL